MFYGRPDTLDTIIQEGGRHNQNGHLRARWGVSGFDDVPSIGKSLIKILSAHLPPCSILMYH
jgi:hypothetical protein